MISFKSKITKKVLNYFFLNEDKKMYINELARMIEEEPKNVHRVLLLLEGTGILSSEFIGKERYFFINKTKPVYKEYKTIFMRTAGLENLLIRTLKRTEGVKEAYIYGSYANNNFKFDSDVDLLLIGEHNVLSMQKKISEIQKEIGREINVVNMSTEEFIEKKNNKDQFIGTVFENKTIKLV